MEERSTDPGVVSDLERLAMRGEEMPDGLSLADQEFFRDWPTYTPGIV